MILNKDDSLLIQGLLTALSDHGFIYIPQVLDEKDSTKLDRVISRKLVLIWFTHPRLMEAARRFISDFLVVIDGTFNTNAARLPLLIAVS